MAYETGTASSPEDLMNALQTFAAAEGWTVDIYSSTNDWLALNNGSVYVQFRWDANGNVAMFHSRGFTSTGTAPGNHTGDDGLGQVDASAPYNQNITAGRRTNFLSTGAMTAYHFFTDNTTKYIHVVVEYAPGRYRHFSFGTIDKIGDWTGGEYAVAHFWAQGSLSDSPTVTSHSVLWDGITSFLDIAGSVHVEGMPDQSGAMQWMVLIDTPSSPGTDRAGVARTRGVGGVRGSNPALAAMGAFRSSVLTGHIPLVQIPIFWHDQSLTPDQRMLLGFAPDVRHMQMAHFQPGDEFQIGSDTWKVFPIVRKQFLQADTEESRNGGIAYKVIA